MPWEVVPAADAVAGVGRYEALQAFVASNEDVLDTAVGRLNDYAGELCPEGDTGTIQLAAALRRIREALINLCQLEKAVLPRETVEQLRADFTFVNINDPVKRRQITEAVAGRPIERLNELTVEEAEALRVELRKHEEAF